MRDRHFLGEKKVYQAVSITHLTLPSQHCFANSFSSSLRQVKSSGISRIKSEGNKKEVLGTMQVITKLTSVTAGLAPFLALPNSNVLYAVTALQVNVHFKERKRGENTYSHV